MIYIKSIANDALYIHSMFYHVSYCIEFKIYLHLDNLQFKYLQNFLRNPKKTG